jgi:hypothetical protein
LSRLGGIGFGEIPGEDRELDRNSIRILRIDRTDPAVVDFEHVSSRIEPALLSAFEVDEVVRREREMIGERVEPQVAANVGTERL